MEKTDIDYVQGILNVQNTVLCTHEIRSSVLLASASIGKHLLETGHTPVIDQAFTVFLKCQNARTLRFAEALAIKTLDPILCVQKKVFCTLKIPWT